MKTRIINGNAQIKVIKAKLFIAKHVRCVGGNWW